MRGLPIRIAHILIAGTAAVSVCAARQSRPYAVESYDITLRADLANKTIHAKARIVLNGTADAPVSALELDSAGPQIVEVLEGSEKQSFEQNRSGLYIALSRPLHQDEKRTLVIRYLAGEGPGVKFFPDQLVAADVAGWLPCNNTAGERSRIHLTVSAPAEMKIAASGRLISTRAQGSETATEWESARPLNPSRFGFVVGKFAVERDSESEGVALRILSTSAALPSLESALRYFEQRTGEKFPGRTYTEAFTDAGLNRTFDGLTILPISAEKDTRLRAEELAHQWFGIGIAPKNATDVWLTEALSVYLAESSGRQSSDGMEQARQAYYRMRSEGRDTPLADTADGDLARCKGVWFLYLVDRLIGQTKFWEGVKFYAINAWGQTATSEDLQKAFDAADSGQPTATGKTDTRRTNPKSLDRLFDAWVYGISQAPEKSRK